MDDAGSISNSITTHAGSILPLPTSVPVPPSLPTPTASHSLPPPATEQTPLLAVDNPQRATISTKKASYANTLSWKARNLREDFHSAFTVNNAKHTLATGVQALPAVLLGSLLNILDGVSCESTAVGYVDNKMLMRRLTTDGMIIFPAAGVFADLGPMGVSMFFLS
jgi:SulP family sulfate permease